MTWRAKYRPDVTGDLERLGRAEAKISLKVITDRIQEGEPDTIGKPLTGGLAGCRRLRTGNTRFGYRMYANVFEVQMIGIGIRRNDEVYVAAGRRI